MKKLILIIIVLAIIGGAGYVFLGKSGIKLDLEKKTDTTITPTIGAVETGALVGKTYTNSVYKFSVELPEGYSAREITGGEAESRSIVFENEKSDGVQIVITPYDDIKVLTADMIKNDIPDMKIDQVQTVDIGQNYKGVAFLGDNAEFGGASRDVWFVFKGNLYQISTYARLDTTLQAIFSTWKFF